MSLYAESSAVLAWLLGDPEGMRVRELLAAADIVVSSDLTLIECDRVLTRAVALGEMAEAAAASRRAILSAASANWVLLRIDEEIRDRARRPFPLEPVRTLDAIHLASSLLARAAVPDISLLSLDERVRSNGRGLGFTLLPE